MAEHSRKSRARRRAKQAVKVKINPAKFLASLLMVALMLFILYAMLKAVFIKGASVNAPLSSAVIPAASTTDSEPDIPHEKLGITVCIDPGHGFTDAGTVSPGSIPFTLYEKDINLAVSLLLRDELQKLGFDVIMTREDDTSRQEKLSLDDRVNFANRACANLFISVHTNSYPDNTDVHGARIYYYNSKDKRADTTARFAETIKQTLDNKYETPTEIYPMERKDSFQVNRDANMPSITFELGFITNLEDAQNLKDSAWQAKMAKDLARGIYNSMKNG